MAGHLAVFTEDMKRGEGGALKAMEPYLPNDIVLLRPKMGFAVPLARWFRGPLRQRVRDSLLNGQIADSGWFNQKMIEQMVDQHESGGAITALRCGPC